MDLKTYYEQYVQNHSGADVYKLETFKDTSRVLLIRNYLKNYVKPGSTVLDIGCGDMYLAKCMPEYAWTGLDIETTLSEGRAIKHDLMQKPYPFPDQIFDAAVCSEVLEHVWDPRIVLDEAKRLVRPGGHFTISTPNFDCVDHPLSQHQGLVFNPKWGHIFEHIRHYNYASLESLLNTAGFVVKDYVGADAHCVHFFQEARQFLYAFFKDQLRMPLSEGHVDALLGQMFRKTSATIIIAAQVQA